MQQLHITNGDIFSARLSNLEIDGDVLTWHENFLLGRVPPISDPGNADVLIRFVQTRSEELSSASDHNQYDVFEALEQQIDDLENHEADEIVVWIENDLYDLLLVAHLTFLMHYLFVEKQPRVSIVHSQRNLMNVPDEDIFQLQKKRRAPSPDLSKGLIEFWFAFTSEKASDLLQWVPANKHHKEPIVAELANSINDYMLLDATTQHNGLHDTIVRASTPTESGAAPRTSEILSRVSAELADRNFLTDVQLDSILDAMHSEQPNALYFGNHLISDLTIDRK